MDEPGPLLDTADGGYVGLAPVEDTEVSRRYVEGTNTQQTGCSSRCSVTVMSIVQLYVDHGPRARRRERAAAHGDRDRACNPWRSPDAAMWELPEQRHYTTSKLGCWMALRQAAHLAELGQLPGSADWWCSEAEQIRRWVKTHRWSDDLAPTPGYPGSERLDASIRLHAISGFDRGERVSSTLDLRHHLGSGPHLYRHSGAVGHEALPSRRTTEPDALLAYRYVIVMSGAGRQPRDARS